MNDIKVGDLVVVVRGKCCQSAYIGYVFKVRRLVAETRTCKGCGQGYFSTFARTGNRKKKPHCAPIECLKRIPPLDELEGEQRKEELTA